MRLVSRGIGRLGLQAGGPWLCCGRGSFGIPLGDRITIFRKEPFDGSAAGHGAIAGRTGCDAGRLEKGVGTGVWSRMSRHAEP